MKRVGLTALTLLALFVVAMFGWLLWLDKPWFNGELAARLKQRPGPFAGHTDVTDVISDLLPLGGHVDAAQASLRSSGFVCSELPASGSPLTCKRVHSTVVCGDTWTIEIGFDAGGKLIQRTADAWTNCL